VVGHKADGRSVYDEQAKAQWVAPCMQPGASVSRLARECGVNANQVCRWLRGRGHIRRPRMATIRGVTTTAPFVAAYFAPSRTPISRDRGQRFTGRRTPFHAERGQRFSLIADSGDGARG
jgi:transposase